MLVSIGLLILSIVLFTRFFSDSNLVSYIAATVYLWIFSLTLSKADHAVFILKIIPEIMNNHKNENLGEESSRVISEYNINYHVPRLYHENIKNGEENE